MKRILEVDSPQSSVDSKSTEETVTKKHRLDDAGWQENLNLCIRTLERFGKIPKIINTPDGKEIDIRWLYEWLRGQKMLLKRNTIQPHRKEPIEKIFRDYPKLLVAVRRDRQNLKEETLQYYREHKKFPPSKTEDKTLHDMSSWYNHTRTKFNSDELPQNEAQDFRQFLIEIEKIRYSDWEEYYPKLLEHIQIHKKMPGISDPCLGSWVNRICNHMIFCEPYLEENRHKYQEIRRLQNEFSKRRDLKEINAESDIN